MQRFGIASGIVIVAAVSLYGGTAAVSPQDVERPSARAIAAIDRVILTSLTKKQDALIVNTHSRMVEECMGDRGYRMHLGRLEPFEIGIAPAYKTRLESWLFDDIRVARRVGYGIASALRRETRAKQRKSAPMQLVSSRDMTRKERQRYSRHYFGSADERVAIRELDGGEVSIPGGGCMGEATRALWGNLKRYLIFLDARSTADDQLWLSTTEAEDVKAALDEWRACIKAGGFKASDPHAAYLEAAKVVMGADAERRAAERERAAVDATCKRSTDLADRFARSYVVNGRTVLRTLGDILREFKDLEDRVFHRARLLAQFGRGTPGS